MPRVVRSAQSEEDLFEIAAFISRDNLDAALRLIDGFDHRFRLLAEFPFLGEARENLAPSLRSLPFGNYLIFYRPMRLGLNRAPVLPCLRLDVP